MNTSTEQVIKYLTDAHAIEQQALRQLETAPGIAGDAQLARDFRDHLHETEEQERLVRERLEQVGAEPSPAKDVAGWAGALPMLAFARLSPDTSGKLTAHAYSYEHMELAAYDLLALVADQLGDTRTAQVARHIREQEAAMAARLERSFDRAVEASLRTIEVDDLESKLVDYLADAHALEAQGIQTLQQAPDMAGEPGLAEVYRRHLDESRAQQQLVEQRLQAHDADPSRLKDAALRLGAINSSVLFAAQPDTPVKLAGFTFAYEHIEVASYELLQRVARRAGDPETAQVAERIAAEERRTAAAIRDRFDAVVALVLRERVAPR